MQGPTSIASALTRADYGSVIVRRAEARDLDAIVLRSMDYAAEVGYPVTPDYKRAAWYFGNFIEMEDRDIVVADYHNTLLGGAAVHTGYEPVAEGPFAYLVKLFVPEEYRRSPVARVVLDGVTDWARERRCHGIFSAAAGYPGTDVQRLTVNLFKRTGYRDTGPSLYMEV